MRLPQIGDSCRRRSDQKLYIIIADRYGKGSRDVKLEPENDGEIYWIADFLLEWSENDKVWRF